MPAYLRGLGDDVVAGHHSPSPVRPQQRGQHADGRCLAGAVGAEHAEDRAARNLEIDARECLGGAEVLLKADRLECQGFVHLHVS